MYYILGNGRRCSRSIARGALECSYHYRIDRTFPSQLDRLNHIPQYYEIHTICDLIPSSSRRTTSNSCSKIFLSCSHLFPLCSSNSETPTPTVLTSLITLQNRNTTNNAAISDSFPLRKNSRMNVVRIMRASKMWR